MYQAAFETIQRSSDWIARLKEMPRIWETGKDEAQAVAKLKQSASGYVKVKESELTKPVGISGCIGFVQGTHHNGKISVIVFDMDGGPAGPYVIETSAIEKITI